MRLTVTEAKAKFTGQVKRAKAGEEVILTRHGHDATHLVAFGGLPRAAARRSVIERVRKSAARKLSTGPSATRSQDFLYDEDGLPQ